MNSFTDWDSELYHHGIKGQKWGVRRFQNEDGSLTAEGQSRYGEGGTATAKERAKFLNKLDQQRAYNVVRMSEVSKKKQSAKKEQKMDAYNRMRANTEKTIASVLRSAEKDGTKINSKDVIRHVTTGKTAAKSIAMTALLSTLITGGSVVSAVGSAQAMAASNALGIGTATANAYLVPYIVTKTTRGKKYKADNRYR